MTEPTNWADELAYARRDAQRERDEHATQHRTHGPGWWPSRDDRDDLDAGDYR